MSEYQLYLNLGGIRYKVKKPKVYKLTINFYEDNVLNNTITKTYASGTTISPTSIATEYLPTDYEVDSTSPTSDFEITEDTTLSVYYKAQASDMPIKGDLITMSLGNATPAAGTNNQYRVLNINGSVAEVVAMYDVSTNQQFSSSSQVYSGSLLDTALNTTWYGTLNDTAKAAIVDKTFKQDSWYMGSSGSPVYSGYYGDSNPGTTSYSVSLANTSFGSEITRKVYALSVQDVLDYITDTSVGDGKLQNYNIWNMFWNTTSKPSTIAYPCLRSAFASDSSFIWYVSVGLGRVRNGNYYITVASRPAFKIDLSKIGWKKYE